MRLAIAAENNQVSAHFGHCEGFSIYNITDGKVESNEFIANPGHQPGFLPVYLKEANVNLIIAGGMGERAQMLFAQNGIDVIVGASGSCEDALNQYLSGNLQSKGEFCKEHEHAHECGEH